MTTPASPAPAASPAPGGGMPAAAPAAPGKAAPQDPPNLVAQAQERSAAAESTDDDGLTPAEERQLGDLLAKRDKSAAARTVRLRVEGEHESVQVGHVVVGREWTEVPVQLVSSVTEGAAEAGVQVTQDESES
jgi:hypothetical protein